MCMIALMNDDKKLYSQYIAKNSKELLDRGIAPDYEGTKHIEFLYLPVTKIKREGNGGRPDDFSHTNMFAISKMIKDGEWKPENHEPPMVVIKDGKFILEAGHHRWNAHVEAEEKFILVSLVEFKDETSRISALLEENTKDKYVKNYASVDNIASSLAQILEIDSKKGIEITELYIKKLIVSKGNVKKSDHSTIREIFNKIINKVTVQTKIKNYTPKEATRVAREIHWSDQEHGERIVPLLRNGESKAQFRLLEKALKIKEQSSPMWDVIAYCHYTDCGKSEIIKNRPKEIERVRKIQDQIVRWAEIINDRHYTEPKLVFLPQLEGEWSHGPKIGEYITTNYNGIKV